MHGGTGFRSRPRRLGALTLAISALGALVFASQASAVNITSTSSAPTIATVINADRRSHSLTASAELRHQPRLAERRMPPPTNAMPTTPAALPLSRGTTFGILTSGDPQLADNPNTSPSSGAYPGRWQHSGGHVRIFDVTILRLPGTVPAVANPCLNFEFRFLSDEYPEFVGTEYNDAFIAELDTSDWSDKWLQRSPAPRTSPRTSSATRSASTRPAVHR